MPHLTIEYSANLEGRADIGELCRTLLKTVLETGLFEIGAVRVRALRADHYAIADELPENGFVDLNFRIGKGRTAEEKKRTGEAIFAAAIDVLGPLFETPHFALSLEIREIDAELSWKKNAIHPRLRG
ncbi:5-carboxymethyl-2-hydroxymuconate isomerase [Rhizobium binae]|uniref:5-carboxymethyl-2-hydroxymuconate isomerase n=1 Tax=Rhizobium binae TaxID=1138190 RepID=A0ABV2MMH8_9HYPH|nr:5-carboxymethyl-2-hydroxymuconate Delta-isomerase [Rhizobium binae]MBX4994551.1 5-carboxymethyl-2-hydroxymuconate Delta-isomerase [Rhizobium binae]NKL50361.1 5-carboxymethyl-2-hydroxymuconate isomerase [Rhizobium leguminosarum bv. viciae]QSY84815.1 5-carboxymethyl-2-hydroxymuconate Delta-isomerase [Rhizobium binae]